MTSRSEISKWYDEGIKSGKVYMLVVCDTYDYEDYPAYCESLEDARRLSNNPGQMQKVMEVYKLIDNEIDKNQQLNQHRAWWSLF